MGALFHHFTCCGSSFLPGWRLAASPSLNMDRCDVMLVEWGAADCPEPNPERARPRQDACRQRQTVGGQGREKAEGRTAHFPGVTSTLTDSLSLSPPPFASIPTRPTAVISIPIGWVWHSFQRPSTRTDAQIMTAMDMNFCSFYPPQIVFNARITIYDSTHIPCVSFQRARG